MDNSEMSPPRIRQRRGMRLILLGLALLLVGLAISVLTPDYLIEPERPVGPSADTIGILTAVSGVVTSLAGLITSIAALRAKRDEPSQAIAKSKGKKGQRRR